MMRELIFSGDELELLVAMDAAGCVLTDNGKFYCDMDNEKLRYSSRLPARIRGTYTRNGEGWLLHCRIAPSPRTATIGGTFAVAFACLLLFVKSLTGAALFAILMVAMAVNYQAQKKDCMRRFAGCFGG